MSSHALLCRGFAASGRASGPGKGDAATLPPRSASNGLPPGRFYTGRAPILQAPLVQRTAEIGERASEWTGERRCRDAATTKCFQRSSTWQILHRTRADFTSAARTTDCRDRRAGERVDRGKEMPRRCHHEVLPTVFHLADFTPDARRFYKRRSYNGLPRSASGRASGPGKGDAATLPPRSASNGLPPGRFYTGRAPLLQAPLVQRTAEIGERASEWTGERRCRDAATTKCFQRSSTWQILHRTRAAFTSAARTTDC